MTQPHPYPLFFLIAIMWVSILRAQTPAVGGARETIDVGDHKLQMVRGGAGRITVVFETGAGGRLTGWLPLAAKVNDFAATICYSRAGAGPQGSAYVRTPVAVATELHVMLERAGVRPPYVLVGHSMGGLYVRAFAIKYPTEIAGLVLVDPTHERQVIVGRQLARQHFGKDQIGAAADAAKFTGTTRLEWDGVESVFESGKLDIQGPLPDVPVALLTSIQASVGLVDGSDLEKVNTVMAAKRAMHAEIIGAISQSQHIVTDRVGHNLHREAPDMVIAAVRWIVTAASVDAPKQETKLER